MKLEAIEEVTEDVLREVVKRIVEAVHPLRIILFGSHARGKPRPGSDLDLLVIAESDEPRWRRAVPVYQSLRGMLIPKDVLVYTPEEVAEWSAVPQAFITTAVREGRLLYERTE